MAVELLEARGFRILACNWRKPDGEIDIVARHGNTCVFIEVRSRTGETFGHALETINAQKRARVIRSARLYLDAEAPDCADFRFDVVGVTFHEDGAPPEVIHVPNAFETT